MLYCTEIKCIIVYAPHLFSTSVLNVYTIDINKGIEFICAEELWHFSYSLFC